MQLSVEARLLAVHTNLSEAEMYIGPQLERADIQALQAATLSTLGTALPESYLDFLSNHDGLVAEGVFLYSGISRPYSDGGSSLALIEMKLLARDRGFMAGYVEHGESDMDCYVFESGTGRHQVRDKVAFDNVYEEFVSFDGLLSHIFDLIEQHC